MEDKDTTHSDLMQAERNNGFLLKIAGSILTAGIIALVSLSWSTTNELAGMRTDVTYIRAALGNFDGRIRSVEQGTYTKQDGEQLKVWTELKLEALIVKINLLSKQVEALERKLASGAR